VPRGRTKPIDHATRFADYKETVTRLVERERDQSVIQRNVVEAVVDRINCRGFIAAITDINDRGACDRYGADFDQFRCHESRRAVSSHQLLMSMSKCDLRTTHKPRS